MRTAGDWLLTLINDLLDIAKLEAGKVVLDASEFSLRAMLEETRRILAPRAAPKGSISTAPSTPTCPTC